MGPYIDEFNRLYDLNKRFQIENNTTQTIPELEAFMIAQFTSINSPFHRENMKSTKQKSLKYFITFTYNNQSTKEQFQQAVIKQLSRDIFSHVTFAFEHIDTNIHCHAIATATHTLNISNFKSHIRKYGHIDIRSVKKDNGLIDYISKESQIQEIENKNLAHI